MEPASPLLSAGFMMVCLLGATRLSAGERNHCPCPAIPSWNRTSAPPEECRQINSTFRYKCLDGFTRKAGTSSLIKCKLKDGIVQWEMPEDQFRLRCIDVLKRAQPQTTKSPVRTTKHHNDTLQNTTMNSTTNVPKRPMPQTTTKSPVGTTKNHSDTLQNATMNTTIKNHSDTLQNTTMNTTTTSSSGLHVNHSTVSQDGPRSDSVDKKSHETVAPTKVKTWKVETSTQSHGASGNRANPTVEALSGTQTAAIISCVLLLIVCSLIGIGCSLYRRRSTSNVTQVPAEELVPMNPPPGPPL